MTARSEITIDMSEFGAEGTIIMTFPSLRRQAMMKNALGNCAKIEVVNGENVVKETNLGDVEIVEVLGFVAKAPFPTDLKGFYAFCDRMDERDLGSASRMFEAMTKAKNAIQEGEVSPFADSQEAETSNSA
jgi:hypothetical protein